MEFAYLLGGGAPIIKKYQIGEAMATAGVPVLAEAAQATAGLVLPANGGSAANMVGVTLDTQATLVTAQQTDDSDPARVVSVIINSDAIWKARMADVTSDTALTLRTVTTASTDGLTITTGDDYSCTNFDGGTIWGFDGANAGIVRRITATSGTAATVTVAFPNDTVVGDSFLRAGPHEGAGVNAGPNLTTTFDQVDVEQAHLTGNDNFRVIEGTFTESSEDGQTNSFFFLISKDHLYGGGGIA